LTKSSKKSTDISKGSPKDLKKILERANLYKDLLAHDMRNALTNIKASIELSSIYLEKAEYNKIPNLIQIILEQVYRGMDLIKNVQNLSYFEYKESDLKKMDLISAIKKAIQIIKGQRPSYKNLDIKIKPIKKKFNVLANDYIIDVFQNILSNAVVHNDNEFISIQIELSIQKKNDREYTQIEIKDNGKGIEDKRKERIFENIKRSDSPIGMGIGLSLVKEIIDIYGGEIWVDDRIKGTPNEGCNFILLIPSAK